MNPIHICPLLLTSFQIFQTIDPRFSRLGAFKRSNSFLAKQLNADKMVSKQLNCPSKQSWLTLSWMSPLLQFPQHTKTHSADLNK